MTKELCINDKRSLRDAIEKLDKTGRGALFILDKSDRMVGLLTDGDVRKAVLQGIDISRPLSDVMNRNFIFGDSTRPREAAVALLRRTKHRHLPILDPQHRLVDVLLLEQIGGPQESAWVVLMAGGLGSRMRPMSDKIPKPMFRVGNRPILETILENFIQFGFERFYIAVNYRSEAITEYFGDGTNWGVDIRYLREEEKMGTAGALRLLPEWPSQPIIVMNADLLTTVNFKSLLDFHRDHHCSATMAVKKYDIQVPFGVVEHDDHHFVSVAEKPTHAFYINAGIYVLEPQALKQVAPAGTFEMTDLFAQLKRAGEPTAVFPIREYWIDVGQMDDFKRANHEFLDHFGAGTEPLP